MKIQIDEIEDQYYIELMARWRTQTGYNIVYSNQKLKEGDIVKVEQQRPSLFRVLKVCRLETWWNRMSVKRKTARLFKGE
jgi:ribosomal protein S17